MLTMRAKAGQSLTLDEMRRSLPAIFSPDAFAGMGRYYQYISTAEVLGRLMTEGFLPVEARASGGVSGWKYTKHMVRLRGASDLAKPDNRFGAADAAYEVILRNAHDGSSAYKLYAGLIKFECSNGLVIGDGTVQSVEILHRLGQHARDRKQKAREKLLGLVASSAMAILGQGPAVAEKVARWQETLLDPEERLALAKAAHKVRFGPTTMIKPEQLLIPRRASEEGKRSVWDVGNVIQENLIQGGIVPEGTVEERKKHSQRYHKTKPIEQIQRDVAINCTLWALMDEAAKNAGGKPKTWTPPRPAALEVYQR